MSKKLDTNKMIESLGAVNNFKRDCIGELEYKITANVIVSKIDEHNEVNIIHDVDVDVQIELDSSVHKVYIMWGDIYGNDFKDKYPYLWGTYSTSYNEMNYSYHQLTILSDSLKIIISKL